MEVCVWMCVSFHFNFLTKYILFITNETSCSTKTFCFLMKYWWCSRCVDWFIGTSPRYFLTLFRPVSNTFISSKKRVINSDVSTLKICYYLTCLFFCLLETAAAVNWRYFTLNPSLTSSYTTWKFLTLKFYPSHDIGFRCTHCVTSERYLFKSNHIKMQTSLPDAILIIFVKRWKIKTHDLLYLRQEILL